MNPKLTPSVRQVKAIAIPNKIAKGLKIFGIPTLSLYILLNPSIANAAPLDTTKIYVLSGPSSPGNTIKNIGTINLSTGAITSVFTSSVGNSAALGFDSTGLNLYYSDRTISPNNLRRYDGTTESGSLGTFAGSDNANNAMLRMSFNGSTGYAVSNNNTLYTFTTGSPSTITSQGAWRYGV